MKLGKSALNFGGECVDQVQLPRNRQLHLVLARTRYHQRGIDIHAITFYNDFACAGFRRCRLIVIGGNSL